MILRKTEIEIIFPTGNSINRFGYRQGKQHDNPLDINDFCHYNCVIELRHLLIFFTNIRNPAIVY